MTTLKVSAAGSHVIEYRSADKAGNTEAIKSVSVLDRRARHVGGLRGRGGRRGRAADDGRLTLGGPATFGPLIPGVAKDYTGVDDGDGDLERPEHRR